MMAEKMEDLSVLLEPRRWAIVQTLLEKATHAIEIGKALSMPRSTVVYNLGILEEKGLVKGRYKILQEPKSKGKAARIYHVNEKKLEYLLKMAESLVHESLSRHAKT